MQMFLLLTWPFEKNIEVTTETGFDAIPQGPFLCLLQVLGPEIERGVAVVF
jgi:hypothetical protein